jgi:hypothetical protein
MYLSAHMQDVSFVNDVTKGTHYEQHYVDWI